MNETIISNEVEETRGMDIEDITNQIPEVTTDNDIQIKEGVEVISQEYVDETLEEIEKMNFIEIGRFLKDVKSQKEQLEAAKESAEQIMSMKDNLASAVGDLGTAIAEADLENELGTENIEEFLAEYDNTMSSLETLINKAEEVNKRFDDIPKTTSFLSKTMLETIDKNEAMLQKEDFRYKNLSIYYKVIREIFTNRDSIDFVMGEIPKNAILLRRFRTSIKKDKTGSVMKNIQKSVTTGFCNTFNVNQMLAFENYLKELCGDANLAFYTQYVLYQIYNKEKTNGKYGKFKWVEVIIMNVSDILTDMYDLPGGKEEYDKKLMMIMDEVQKLLSK